MSPKKQIDNCSTQEKSTIQNSFKLNVCDMRVQVLLVRSPYFKARKYTLSTIPVEPLASVP